MATPTFFNKLTAVTLALACIAAAVGPSRGEDGGELTCEEVTEWLTPCISYGVFGGTVSPECCDGIKKLVAAKKTKDDIRTSCTCIQNGAALIIGIDYDRINEIPTLCGTTCSYKVYPSTDCSKVA